MAIGKTTVVNENGSSFLRVIGVGNFEVCGVNLNKEELSALYGRDVQNDPVYLSTITVNDKQVETVAITFYLKGMFKEEPIFLSARYRLQKAPQVGTNSGKYHVIDKYGRTAWVTKAELDAHQLPENQRVSADYRPMYGRDEEGLIKFLRALLGVPQVEKWRRENGKAVFDGLIDKPEEALCSLDDMNKLFAGDFSEIRAAIAGTTNKIKFLVGVRKSEDNRTYQDVFVDCPMAANTSSYARVEKEYKDAQDNGRYANTVFEICDLKEWTEQPTDFSGVAEGASAPAPAADSNPWFK